MRNDVKKAIGMFHHNSIGLLIWLYCDYYKLSAQEFDKKAGSAYYYRLTKVKHTDYHSSTIRNVLSAIGLSREQYATFCVFSRRVKQEGIIAIPASINNVVWIVYFFDVLLMRLFLNPTPWAEEDSMKKGE